MKLATEQKREWLDENGKALEVEIISVDGGLGGSQVKHLYMLVSQSPVRIPTMYSLSY